MRNRLAVVTDRVLGTPQQGNPFGLVEALLGLLVGFLLATVALSGYDSLEHLHGTSVTYGQTAVSLAGLWVGFIGSAVAASWLRVPPAATPAAAAVRRGTGSVIADYGCRLRPWPDVPLGIAVGVASQFLLIPLLELPLQPFVPHLTQRLGGPANQLLSPATSSGTGGLVLVAVLICVGSPIVEELFFRGLVLRALLWRLRPLGSRLGPALSIVLTGLFFGLVHFEALQFLGLAGFGMVLGLLAWRSGRLGPSIVAHMAFNATTVIAYVITH
ncbi:MAG: lysostaphin resistance A-like protein [Acidimicrobiales bacterium]